MNKYDIEIDLNSLESTINKMSNNLTKLENEMNNINDAYLSLDESKWLGFDKKKIDSGFGTYLKSMTNFSNDLRNTLDVLKNGFSKYEDIEQQEKKNIQELEEL